MISYFGGKNKMSKWIYDFIPQEEINTYVEVFSGAMWLYFNEDFSFSNKCVYNDINKLQMNLYKCAALDSDLLVEKIEEAINPGGYLYHDNSDKKEFRDHFKEIWNSYKKDGFLDTYEFETPDYDRAVKWLFMITSSFNGCHPYGAGFSGVTKSVKLKLTAFLNKIKKDKFREKLSSLTYESIDFEKLIEKYDAEDTFFYLDPPYADDLGPFDEKVNKRLHWYGVDNDKFGPSSHYRLADILHNTKGKWALSYYHFPQLDTWFPQDKYRWEFKEFFRSSASFKEGKAEKGKELIIMNY